MRSAPVSYRRLLCLLPPWLAVVFYLPTLSHGFVWDDTYFLLDLPYLRDPSLWWQAIQQPLFVSQNYFRPLPLLMFVLEASLDGPGAFVFHLVNVALHALNTLLVVLLARTLLPADRRGAWLAACAGLLFALHPAVVESVSWISDRFDLLMVFFILLALSLEQRMAMPGASRRLGLVGLSLCLGGALLSKETGVVLLLLLPLWQLRRELCPGMIWGDTLRHWAHTQRALYACLALTVVAYLGLRHAALGFLYRSDTQIVAGDLLSHALLVGKTLGCYLQLLLFPFGQVAPVHPAITPIALNDLSAWGGLITAVLLVVALLRGVRHGRSSCVLPLMALAALVPVANLLPLTIGDNIAHDRYLLLPVAFTALWLAQLLYAVAARPPLYLAAAWLLAASVCVVTTIPHWHNNLALWRWAYTKHPGSQIASGNYLLALLEAQQNRAALTLSRDLLARTQAPAFAASLRHSLALALLRTGDMQGAEREIKLRLDFPRRDDGAGRYGVSEALNLLAHIQMEQGRLSAAAANLREAVRLTPHLPRPHYNLALLHYARGELAQGDTELALTLRYAAPQHAPLFSRQAERARARALES